MKENKKLGWKDYIILSFIGASLTLNITYGIEKITKKIRARNLENYIENIDLLECYSKKEITKGKKSLENIQLSSLKAPANEKGIENIIENIVMFSDVFVPKIKVSDFTNNSKPNPLVTYLTYSNGCGLLISKFGHIITSEHVIKNKFNDYNKNVIIDPKKKTIHDITILAIDPSNDLALVKADNFYRKNFKTPEFLKSTAIKKKSLVYSNRVYLENFSIDFYSKDQFFIKDKSSIKIKTDSRQGKILKDFHNSIENSNRGYAINDYLLAENISKSGFSGSPAFNDAGQVLGIIKGGNKKYTIISLSDACYDLIENYVNNQK